MGQLRFEKRCGDDDNGPIMSSRKDYVGHVRTLVVKLGTHLLSDGQGRIDLPAVRRAESPSKWLGCDSMMGVRVTIVNSGAIGCGLRELGLGQRPTHWRKLQAIAAVGQRRRDEERRESLIDQLGGSFGATQPHCCRQPAKDSQFVQGNRGPRRRGDCLVAHPLTSESSATWFQESARRQEPTDERR